jgi:hypothetical protein
MRAAFATGMCTLHPSSCLDARDVGVELETRIVADSVYVVVRES